MPAPDHANVNLIAAGIKERHVWTLDLQELPPPKRAAAMLMGKLVQVPHKPRAKLSHCGYCQLLLSIPHTCLRLRKP